VIAAFVYHHCKQSWNAIPAIIHHAPVLGETGEMDEIEITPSCLSSQFCGGHSHDCVDTKRSMHWWAFRARRRDWIGDGIRIILVLI
jgi:hypothetical protein